VLTVVKILRGILMTGSWKTFSVPNTSTGTFSADIMILLTDGSVLVHHADLSAATLSNSNQWQRLMPDSHGHYETGTWSGELRMQYARQFFASGVLSDGRVFVIGGEYSNDPAAGQAGQNDAWSGEIFDPQTNSWTPIDKPAAFQFVRGDCNGSVLADGRVLLGGASTTEPPSTWSKLTAIWNPHDNTWTQAGRRFGVLRTTTKEDPFEEETFCLLPDGSVLAPAVRDTPKTQRYVPSLDQWADCAACPVQLPVNFIQGVQVEETGPTILLPSGVVFAIGGSGQTALYTPSPASDPTGKGSWTPGPAFPPDTSTNPNWPTLTALDAPACLLPSGKVVCMGGTTSPSVSNNVVTDYLSQNPVLLEYDPASRATTLPPLDVQPNLPARNQTWQSFMLLLPTGQLLLSAQTNTLYLYTPDPASGGPADGWRPVITACPAGLAPGQSYTVSGTQLTGLSQAVGYGDDAGMATNYPLVKLSNGAGDVSYLPTSNFSTMGVATGTETVSASFLVTGVTPGSWQLAVIANGIASEPVDVEVTATSAQICQDLIDNVFQLRTDHGPPVTGQEYDNIVGQLNLCRTSHFITQEQYSQALKALQDVNKDSGGIPR
jgi:hypothetical protein